MSYLQFIIKDEFILDKAILLKNIIKVPIVFCAELIKDYPEFSKKLFMPYDEIKKACEYHAKYMPKIPITENHVNMFDKDGEERPLQLDDPEVIGYISQIKANDKKRRGQGWAYINKNKISEFLEGYLLRGSLVGTSVGGMGKVIPTPGLYQDERYDGIQTDFHFHHDALVTMGLPRCPTNICGFNFKDSNELYSCIRESTHHKAIKNPEWKVEKVLANAINDCRKIEEIQESFDFSPDIPDEKFKGFYDYLTDANLIPKEACVLTFYNELKNTYSDVKWWADDPTDNDGLKNKESKSSLTIIDLIKNFKVGNLAEELEKILAMKDQKISDLTKKLAEFETENIKEMKDAIVALKAQNTELRKENQTIKDEYEDARQFVLQYRQAEISLMMDLLVKSEKYTQEELAPLKYKELKDTFEHAKRFLDLGDVKVIPTQPAMATQFVPNPYALRINPNQVQQPPAQGFSTIPKPLPNQLTDNVPKPRTYQVGSIPNMEDILNKDYERWKTK